LSWKLKINKFLLTYSAHLWIQGHSEVLSHNWPAGQSELTLQHGGLYADAKVAKIVKRSKSEKKLVLGFILILTFFCGVECQVYLYCSEA